MQTPMCIAPSSGCALGVHARVRWCEREVGVHGEPATRAPREGDREPPGPRERRAVGSHAERVPGRRDPGLVALNRTACLIATNREVANAWPHAPPLRLLEDGHPTLLEVAAPDLERLVRQEAEVARAWRRPRRLQPELPPGRVQVDLLRSESQREPARREPHRLHAEDPAVEVARGVEIADGQHQVVEAIERHRARWVKTDSGRNAETIQLGVSTIALILRSTATLERMDASWRDSPRSGTG